MKKSLMVLSLVLLSGSTLAYAATQKTTSSTLSTVKANSNIEKLVFAMGCYWCAESDFTELQEKLGSGAIISIKPGFAANNSKAAKKTPTYESVSYNGLKGYRESVEVTYDKSKVTPATLIEFFFTHIDPTDKGGQFCDRGAQYTTAIYTTTNAQEKVAHVVKNELVHALENVGKKGAKFNAKVYTEIENNYNFSVTDVKSHIKYFKKHSIKYKFYRWNCGRDAKIKNIWYSNTKFHNELKSKDWPFLPVNSVNPN